MISESDELRKRYGKRYAFEWFMRAEDKRYWRMTQNMIDRESKKTTALIGINAVVTIAAILITMLVGYINKE